MPQFGQCESHLSYALPYVLSYVAGRPEIIVGRFACRGS